MTHLTPARGILATEQPTDVDQDRGDRYRCCAQRAAKRRPRARGSARIARRPSPACWPPTRVGNLAVRSASIFTDVVESTALGERIEAETLRQVMARYFDEMRIVVTRHGGTVEKFIGDAVMAVFGIPRVHEDDALRAVRAADEMRHALAELNGRLTTEWGVRIEVRCGVNTGEVVVGSMGQGTFVTGSPVNLAARLEQAAEPGQILLGPDTFRLVRDMVEADAGDTAHDEGVHRPDHPHGAGVGDRGTGAGRGRPQPTRRQGR